MRHSVCVVPILRDPELREPTRTPVCVDAILPRSLEQREATGVLGLADRAEGPAGLDSRADRPGERDPRTPCFAIPVRASDSGRAAPPLSGPGGQCSKEI